MQRSGTCTRAALLIYRFPVQFAMLSWRRALHEEHRWVPNSGWITFHVRSEEDFNRAVWLLRLSCLRYAMKAAPDPCELLDRQSQELDLSPNFRSLLEPLPPVKATRGSTELLRT